MKPGTICIEENFSFGNGKAKRKFFIVLNDGEHFPYIAVVTTSFQREMGSVYGCQGGDRFRNFYLPHGSCYFEMHCWVQLNRFYIFDVENLRQKVVNVEVKQTGLLPGKQLLPLIQCAVDSEDLTNPQEKELRRTLALLSGNPP